MGFVTDMLFWDKDTVEGGGLRWDRGIGHDWGAEDMNFDIFPTLRSGRTDFRVQG